MLRLAQEVDTTPAPPLSAPRPPTAGASERAGLRGLPWPVTSVSSLEFEVTQVFKLIKTAPAVVAGNGQVVVATPAGTLYGLPNPDNAGVSWVSQPSGFPAGGWVEGGSDDEKDNSCCYDLLLDQGNNIYAVITERNLLDGRVYAYQPGGQVSKWGTPYADLQTNLQLLEVYHISALEVGAAGALFVPTFSLLTKVGMVIVDTATGATTNVSLDADPSVPLAYAGYGSATGNAWIDSTNGAAVMSTHANPAGGYAVQGWNKGSPSSPLWSSSKGDFITGITQSNPTVDPWKKCGRRVSRHVRDCSDETWTPLCRPLLPPFSSSPPAAAQVHLLYWPAGPQGARELLLRAGGLRWAHPSVLPWLYGQGCRDQ